MANESGWVLHNCAPFEATWDGGDGTEATVIRYAKDVPSEERLAFSQFGYGIVTFRLRCLIRTPDGYNVLARGLANSPKDGIAALEGLDRDGLGGCAVHHELEAHPAWQRSLRTRRAVLPDRPPAPR